MCLYLDTQRHREPPPRSLQNLSPFLEYLGHGIINSSEDNTRVNGNMDRFEELYASTPPAPPPKPGSHEVSAINTPITSQSPRPAPPLPDQQQHSDLPEAAGLATAQQAQIARPQAIPDPGDQWLPRFLEDKPYGSRTLSTAMVSKWLVTTAI